MARKAHVVASDNAFANVGRPRPTEALAGPDLALKIVRGEGFQFLGVPPRGDAVDVRGGARRMASCEPSPAATCRRVATT